MSADVRYALHVLELAVYIALVYGYNHKEHPPFWVLLLLGIPIALVVNLVTLLIFGLIA